MTYLRSSLLLLSLLCLSFLPANAQGTEIGFGPGLSFYGGDVSGLKFGDYFNNLSLGGTVFLRTPLNRRLDWRFAFAYAPLRGDDAQEGRPRNLSFRNDLLELSVNVDWNVVAFNTDNGPLTFYLFAGGAVAYHNPKAAFQGTFVELQPLGTEGQGLPGQPQRYSKWQPTIPAGGGLKLPLGPQWALQGEFGGRITFTDYLDDVSTNTIRYDELLAGNGPLAATLNNRQFELDGTEPGATTIDPDMPRGNRVRDYYYMGSLTLIYRFAGTPGSHRGARCPTF